MPDRPPQSPPPISERAGASAYDEQTRREAEAFYAQIVAELSPEDRHALYLDGMVYGRASVERTADGRARRVPPSEWMNETTRGRRAAPEAE